VSADEAEKGGEFKEREVAVGAVGEVDLAICLDVVDVGEGGWDGSEDDTGMVVQRIPFVFVFVCGWGRYVRCNGDDRVWGFALLYEHAFNENGFFGVVIGRCDSHTEKHVVVLFVDHGRTPIMSGRRGVSHAYLDPVYESVRLVDQLGRPDIERRGMIEDGRLQVTVVHDLGEIVRQCVLEQMHDGGSENKSERVGGQRERWSQQPAESRDLSVSGRSPYGARAHRKR